MSRIAKNPVVIPAGVEYTLDGQHLFVKGAKGALERDIHPLVLIQSEERSLAFKVLDAKNHKAVALSGTMRALVANMVQGVSVGFEIGLELHGVGYRAELKGSQLELNLGFSHPIYYDIPDGIQIDVLRPTELVVRGIDKQLVGQVVANIRAFRPPEPYQGKGVRRKGEQIVLKEVKKK